MAGRNEHFLEPQTLDVCLAHLTWFGSTYLLMAVSSPIKVTKLNWCISDFTSNSIWSSWNTFSFWKVAKKKSCLLSLTSSNWFVTIHPDLCKPSMFYQCFSLKAALFGKRSEWQTKNKNPGLGWSFYRMNISWSSSSRFLTAKTVHKTVFVVKNWMSLRKSLLRIIKKTRPAKRLVPPNY